MDAITIRDLRVETRSGVTAAERENAQVVVINVDIAADLAAAGESDDLADTVDYATVTREVAALVRSSETHLLEAIAHKIARHIAPMKGVRGVTVEVVKPAPPMEEDVGPVSVRVERL